MIIDSKIEGLGIIDIDKIISTLENNKNQFAPKKSYQDIINNIDLYFAENNSKIEFLENIGSPNYKDIKIDLDKIKEAKANMIQIVVYLTKIETLLKRAIKEKERLKL